MGRESPAARCEGAAANSSGDDVCLNFLAMEEFDMLRSGGAEARFKTAVAQLLGSVSRFVRVKRFAALGANE